MTLEISRPRVPELLSIPDAKRAPQDSVSNYTNLFNLVDVVNIAPTASNYVASVESLVDVEEWARIFAVEKIRQIHVRLQPRRRIIHGEEHKLRPHLRLASEKFHPVVERPLHFRSLKPELSLRRCESGDDDEQNLKRLSFAVHSAGAK